MCRWLAYTGAPVFLEDLIFRPERSLIDQSLHADYSEITTNGDGFGVGWYGQREFPGLYRSVRPAWNDRNLIDLSAQISSPMFLAHVRATTGTDVQRSNCHPFRFGRWLFMHNGGVKEFQKLRRELAFGVDSQFFPEIAGTTDSEIMFYLAVTFGLLSDPVPALEMMAGFVEETGKHHGVEEPVQMTLGLSDGERIYAVRYSSGGRTQTLYHSKSMEALRELRPDLEAHFSSEARIVVSEPLTQLGDYWDEIPESSLVIVHGGSVTTRPFQPRLPH
jgi:glutamine amidotransferase